MKKNTRVKMISLLILLLTNEAFGWSYKEHFNITTRAIDEVCMRKESLGRNSILFCQSRAARYCYAHMVALSGDHVVDPKLLIDSNSGLLKHENFTCTEYLDLNNSELSQVLLPLEDQKLTQPGFKGWINYLKLLPDNFSHFQPSAKSEWEKHASRSIDQELTLSDRLAESAFSMHFLQDSFSAGHSGIDRTLRQQNYDNAHHDDWNHTGLFLKTETASWHTYGDKGLDYPTLYLTEVGSCTDRAAFDAYRERIVDGLSVQNLIPSINGRIGICEGALPEAFSLQPSRWGILSLCFYMDNCDKVEIFPGLPNDYLQSDMPDLLAIEKSCVTPFEGMKEIKACYPTRFFVQKATEENLLLFLNSSDGRGESLADVAKLIPTQYRTQISEEYQGINNVSSVISYSDWRPTNEYSKEEFRNWSFGLSSKIENGVLSENETLLWGLHGPLLGTKFNNEISFDVINRRGDFADGADWYISYDMYRILYNIIGVSPKIAIGVDDLWKGEEYRSLYYGGGFDLNLNIGKTNFFIEILKLKPTNHRILEGDTIELRVGWSTSSVVLN